MTGMTIPTNLVSVTGVDAARLPWSAFPIPQIDAEISIKPVFDDPDTGMQVMMLRYPAGFTNVWHTHPCAHGMYVLDGVLKTHEGEYGPGSFVWFSEGGWMEHGATADVDVTCLFVTNKPFAICYEVDAEHCYPMTAD